MTTARNRTIALLVCLAALAGACSKAEPTTPAATLGAAPSETAPATEPPTEAASEDPYAIPADPKDIDEAYVERVLTQLTRPISEAARVVVRENAVTPEARGLLGATHKDSALRGVTAAFKSAIRDRPARKVFNPRATPIGIRVREVVSADHLCIFALALQDTSGLGRQEIKPFPGYYQLERKLAEDDPNQTNPTPWMIVADAEPLKGGKEYADPCS